MPLIQNSDKMDKNYNFSIPYPNGLIRFISFWKKNKTIYSKLSYCEVNIILLVVTLVTHSNPCLIATAQAVKIICTCIYMYSIDITLSDIKKVESIIVMALHNFFSTMTSYFFKVCRLVLNLFYVKKRTTFLLQGKNGAWK